MRALPFVSQRPKTLYCVSHVPLPVWRRPQVPGGSWDLHLQSSVRTNFPGVRFCQLGGWEEQYVSMPAHLVPLPVRVLLHLSVEHFVLAENRRKAAVSATKAGHVPALSEHELEPCKGTVGSLVVGFPDGNFAPRTGNRCWQPQNC